jgi:hypothetical protein
MTAVHQFLATIVAAATIGLVVAATWSMLSWRHSAGRTDHRLAVDRLVLVVIALVAANGIVGLAVVAAGPRPADPLHLLYGPAALVTLPLGWWLGRRSGRPSGPDRARTDLWLAVAAIVLLGIELRLVMTG